MRRIVLLLVVFLTLSVGHLKAQQFGGFPPSTHWKQINTDTARIIFNAPSQLQAERIATLVHRMAAERPNALGRDVNKINIVLHKNTTLANGYVALAPFRSEYYLIPSTNIFELGNLPWFEHLAVHEYRHVQQYNNFNHGLTKVFRFFLGQEGQALANSTTIPNWFFEGDAVHAETALTPQGRGRLPYFLSGYNSLWQEDKNYSLMKLLNGSIKDYVPNHYQFGYLVVNYGYEKYGPDFWAKVTKDASAFKGLVYPFRKAIKEYSGVRYRNFVANALHYYQQKIPAETKNKNPEKAVASYYFPQIIGKDSLLYVKESYKTLPAFYIKDAQGEHKLKLRNISSEDWFSYRNGTIAYTAFGVNARWSLTDFSDIVLLDIHTGEERKITKGKKYFTPDIAPSGNTIVAVNINDSTATELHLLNSADGALLKKIVAQDGAFFLHPRFIDEENIVLGIRKPNGAIALSRMHLPDEQIESLTPESYNVLGYPSVENNTVYFTAAYEANDDLYALRLQDKKIFKLTSGQTGNYYADAYGDSLVWSHFTAEGLKPRQHKLTSLPWAEMNPMAVQEQSLLYPVADETKNILPTPTRNFAIKNYKKSTGLFNIHSWRPYYEDPEFTFSVYSDNILNTFSNRYYYRYNQNEQSNAVGASTAYAGLFPVFTAGAEYTYNRHVRVRTRQSVINALFNEYEVKGGYYIPLNFSGGNTYKSVTFGTNYVYKRLMPVQDTKKYFQPFTTTYLQHYINWSQQLPRAAQHIYPMLGYSLSTSYRHRLDKKGYQFLSNARLYLPSFAHHSIVLSGSFQQTDTGNVIFSNQFANSRGYSAFDSTKMWRASVNYHFPLAYPDWGFGGIVYFLRIRANVFYDYTRLYASNKLKTLNLRSTGAELYFDTKWWNQLPFTIGVRYSRLLDADLARTQNKNVWEIVIPVSLISN